MAPPITEPSGPRMAPTSHPRRRSTQIAAAASGASSDRRELPRLPDDHRPHLALRDLFTILQDVLQS
jgi:hypothetical protein